MPACKTFSWSLLGGCLCLLVTGCTSTGDLLSPLTQGSGPMDAAEIHHVNFSIARALEKEGRLEAAARLYEKILEDAPDRLDIVQRLAITEDKRGRHEQAEGYFLRALEDDPDNPGLLADYGYSLYLTERFDEAEQRLRQALAIDPQLDRAWVNLGLVLAATERFDKAEGAFTKGGLSRVEANMNIAYALAVSGDLKQARALYSQMRSRHPGDEEIVQRIEQVNHLLAKIEESPANQQSQGASFIAQTEAAPEADDETAPPESHAILPARNAATPERSVVRFADYEQPQP